MRPPLVCDGVEYHDNGRPEFGQICVVSHDGKYIKGTYGGYLPYCRKHKIVNCTEYTCSKVMIKTDRRIQTLWITHDVIRTTKN